MSNEHRVVVPPGCGRRDAAPGWYSRFMSRPEPRACVICGAVFSPTRYSTRSKGDAQMTCGFACAQARRARESAAVRGDAQRGRGLGKTYRKNGGQHEHRTVAEATLGRKLVRGEVVHHINGDHRDNRPENLVVITQAQHMREHGWGILTDRRCEVEDCERRHYARGMCGMHYQRDYARRARETAAR